MKTPLIAIFAFLIHQFSYAQFDDKFYYPSKEIKDLHQKINYEEFSLKTDLDTITGIKVIPKEKPKAVVLYFHGNGGNVYNYLPLTKELVEKNYLVYMIDFRGYGKSTGKPTHLNIKDDGQQFLDYVINENKKQKFIIYGISIGTQIATHLAKNNSKKLSGLVLEGGMSSFTDIAMYASPENKEVISKYVVSPYTAKEDIKSVGIPKIFIHSPEDKVVPIEQGKLNFENASENKKWIEFHGKHLDGMIEISKTIVEEINKLISKNN